MIWRRFGPDGDCAFDHGFCTHAAAVAGAVNFRDTAAGDDLDCHLRCRACSASVKAVMSLCTRSSDAEGDAGGDGGCFV